MNELHRKNDSRIAVGHHESVPEILRADAKYIGISDLLEGSEIGWQASGIHVQ